MRDLTRLSYLMRWAPQADVRKPSHPLSTLFEKVRALSALEKKTSADSARLEEELEKLFADRPSVWESPALSRAIDDATTTCRRKDLKALFNKVVIGPSNSKEYRRMMNLTLDIVEGRLPRNQRTEIVLGMSGMTLFAFKGDEKEILEKIRALEAIQRFPTPKKVIVKMIVLRLNRIRQNVENVNQRRAQIRADDAAFGLLKPGDPNYYPGYVRRGRPDVTIPEIPTIDACIAACRMLKAEPDIWSEYYKDLTELLQRENVCEETYRAAWDVYVVRGVMDS